MTAGARTRRGLGTLAAAVALFAAGVLAGRERVSEREAGAGVARYALLLYGGLPREAATEMGGVEAHRRWARELARRGHYVSGEKLGAEAREVSGGVGRTGGGVAESALSGFFIVSARSAAEAEAIARTIPHLRDGGRVVLRPVDPT